MVKKKERISRRKGEKYEELGRIERKLMGKHKDRFKS